jgi:hypothetical protein
VAKGYFQILSWFQSQELASDQWQTALSRILGNLMMIYWSHLLLAGLVQIYAFFVRHIASGWWHVTMFNLTFFERQVASGWCHVSMFRFYVFSRPDSKRLEWLRSPVDPVLRSCRSDTSLFYKKKWLVIDKTSADNFHVKYILWKIHPF